MTTNQSASDLEDLLDTYASWVVNWAEGVITDTKYKHARNHTLHAIQRIIREARIESLEDLPIYGDHTALQKIIEERLSALRSEDITSKGDK